MHKIDNSISYSEDAQSILEFIIAIRSRTKDYFTSLLENRGVGSFKQDDGRPFNRNLLFNRNAVGPILQIYTPSWLDEIKRNHLQLWSTADHDPRVGNLFTFINDFKHEWEDFFQTLSNRFPDDAAGLLSDFEYAGIEMFGNLEASITFAQAKAPNAEVNHKCFVDYLPEIKKLFIKAGQKSSPFTEGIKTPRPKTVNDIIQNEIDKEQKKEQEHINLLKSSFAENCCFEYAAIQCVAKPDATAYFAKLISLIEYAILELKSEKMKGPGTFNTWQLILPSALTFPTDKFEYSETHKDDDDPQCFSEILESGERVYIKCWDELHPLSAPVQKVQELTQSYLENALKLAKLKKSKSEDLWARALGYFKRIDHAFHLTKNKDIINQLAKIMVDAASRLSIDLTFD